MTPVIFPFLVLKKFLPSLRVAKTVSDLPLWYRLLFGDADLPYKIEKRYIFGIETEVRFYRFGEAKWVVVPHYMDLSSKGRNK